MLRHDAGARGSRRGIDDALIAWTTADLNGRMSAGAQLVRQDPDGDRRHARRRA